MGFPPPISVPFHPYLTYLHHTPLCAHSITSWCCQTPGQRGDGLGTSTPASLVPRAPASRVPRAPASRVLHAPASRVPALSTSAELSFIGGAAPSHPLLPPFPHLHDPSGDTWGAPSSFSRPLVAASRCQHNPAPVEASPSARMEPRLGGGRVPSPWWSPRPRCWAPGAPPALTASPALPPPPPWGVSCG